MEFSRILDLFLFAVPSLIVGIIAYYFFKEHTKNEAGRNLSQQIYISDKCWSIVTTAKNATIQLIRKASMQEKTDSANKLREVILTEMMERRSPSDAALSFIKEEVSDLW